MVTKKKKSHQRIWIQKSLIEGPPKPKAVRRKSLGGGSGSGGPLPPEEEKVEWEWKQGRLVGQDEKGLVIDLFEGTEIPLPEDQTSGKRVKLPASALTSAGKAVLANDYPMEDGMIVCPHDLIQLTHLHEPSVVECLQERFYQSHIYTRTGPVLIALNPFESLPHLYSLSVMESYWNRAEQVGKSKEEEILPHVFDIADGAFRQMQRSLDAQIHVEKPVGCQQAILVSGESGAGKTVTTKFVMKYLATLSERLATIRSKRATKKPTTQISRNTTNPSSRFSAISKKIVAQPLWSMATAGAGENRSRSPLRAPTSPVRARSRSRGSLTSPRARSRSRGPPGSPADRSQSRGPPGSPTSPGRRSFQCKSMEAAKSTNGIESQVLQSNPILESFGNARTVRNDNSSRFGKFIEMQFTRLGKLVGAQIETYLLEKVRLVQQNLGERNYHVFFEVLSGKMSSEELALYHLESSSKAIDFRITTSGTYDRRDKVSDGDTYQELRQAMNAMKFSAKEQENIFGVVAAVLHGSNLQLEDVDDVATLNKDNKHLDAMCALMGLTANDLEQALCTAKVTINKKTFERRLTATNAEKGLEALLKTSYGALFAFLVARINDLIACRKTNDPLMQPVATIGVLDIFGFETFRTNSFEQLCINFCNETLQQQFNAFVLQNEQAEYKREGIDWSFIEFPENQDVLDLIEKRGKGILNILDDHCRTPQPKDQAFAFDVYKICAPHTRFSASKKQTYSLQFTVEHYAGPVEYMMETFTEKNCDDLPKEATELLQNSSNPFIRQLAKVIEHGHDLPAALDLDAPPAKSTSSQRSTVSEQFRLQLKNLRTKIDRTSPHYIRCLKPNALLEGGVFDTGSIAEQLRCGGILEAVRVSRAGFAQHYPHGAFVARYGALAGMKTKKGEDSRDVCEKLVERLKNAVFRQTSSDKLIQMGKTKVFLTKTAFDTLEQSHGARQDIAATTLNSIFRRYLARVNFPKLLEIYRKEIADGKRKEELEKEARERRKMADLERRRRMGLPDEEDGVDSTDEQLKADFAFNKLLGYHKDVLTKFGGTVPVSKKSTEELEWVCENGRWVRKKVSGSPPVKLTTEASGDPEKSPEETPVEP